MFNATISDVTIGVGLMGIFAKDGDIMGWLEQSQHYTMIDAEKSYSMFSNIASAMGKTASRPILKTGAEIHQECLSRGINSPVVGAMFTKTYMFMYY